MGMANGMASPQSMQPVQHMQPVQQQYYAQVGRSNGINQLRIQSNESYKVGEMLVDQRFQGKTPSIYRLIDKGS